MQNKKILDIKILGIIFYLTCGAVFGQVDAKNQPNSIPDTNTTNNPTANGEYNKWVKMLIRNDFDGIVQETTAELNSNPNNALALRIRASAYYNLDRSEEAESDLETVLRLLPNAATAEEYEARCFAQRNVGDSNAAMQDCTEAIKLKPEFALAYNTRANGYRNLKEYDLAIADYDKAIELDSEFIVAYNSRGIAYQSKEDYDQAINSYSKAIELNPRYILAYNNRADSYFKKKDYDKAIADFTKLIEINPETIRTYGNRGVSYFQKNDHDKAIADFTKVIEIDSKNSQAFYFRGLTYNYKKDYDKANLDLQKAVELAPKDAEKHYAFGINLFEKEYETLISGKQLSKLKYQTEDMSAHAEVLRLSVTALIKATSLDPKRANAYADLGAALALYRVIMSNFYFCNEVCRSEALKYSNKAVQIDPLNPYVYSSRAKAYLAFTEVGGDDTDMLLQKYREDIAKYEELLK